MKQINIKNLKSRAQNRPSGYVEEVLSMGNVVDAILFLSDEDYEFLCKKYRKTPVAPYIKFPETKNQGVGSELKKLLEKIGIKSTKNCSCNRRAAQMDVNGVEWCKQNLQTIVGWLSEEALNRKILFSEYLAGKIVKMAINKYEKIQHNIRRESNCIS